MTGRYCRLEPLDPERHAAELYAAFAKDAEGRIWTYLPYGPFTDLANFRAWITRECLGLDPLFFAIMDEATGSPAGLISYLRIAQEVGSIEVGHVILSPSLCRTRAATEVQFLLLDRAFALGYRRYEWKCDSLNAASRAAAKRLGFIHEGEFRQATVYKGRNRDTAWYSIIDREWPTLRGVYEAWLNPENFDAAGCQKTQLSNAIAEARNDGAAG